MKVFIYLLIAIATGLLIYNIFKVDFESPFGGDSTIALIGVVACLCAIVLLVILSISRKIARKAK